MIIQVKKENHDFTFKTIYDSKVYKKHNLNK